MKRAHRLAVAFAVIAVVCLANPLYASAIPTGGGLPYPALGGDAAAFAPDLRYLVRLGLSAVGAFALVGAIASLFAGADALDSDARERR